MRSSLVCAVLLVATLGCQTASRPSLNPGTNEHWLQHATVAPRAVIAQTIETEVVDLVATQSPQDAKVVANGSLVIGGGGGMPPLVIAEFLRLAGGSKSRLVIIPTASSRADKPDNGKTVKLWQERGAGVANLLHTRSKDEANRASFVAILKKATGVWIGGGSQSRIMAAYLGTKVETELKALLKRGGVIGGSSAGAAIMTKLMISGGRGEAKTKQGFGFLPGAVVDQHFLRRNRVNRLLDALHRHPGLVGIGIDEGTAIVWSGDEIRTIGESYVSVFVPQSDGKPMRVEILNDGEKLSLRSLLRDAGRRPK